VQTKHATLVAAVDGLGHGPAAAAAAELACRVLEQRAAAPLSELLADCHDRLRHSRGIVLTAARVGSIPGSIEWTGVGNVDGRVMSTDQAAKDHSVLLRGGIVGQNMPTVTPTTVPVDGGETLVLATDGVHSSFADTLNRADPPAKMAQTILSRHSSQRDDALVVVARIRAAPT
jgi:hypothetical protein